MAYEKIVAVYDKAGKAKEAARALEASGFAAGDISVLNRDSLSDAEVHEAGLWRRLFGRNVGDHESAVYGRTVESGGAVLTLRTADTEVPRAMKILDVHNPVDVNERATSLGVAPPAARVPVGQPAMSPPVPSAKLTKEEVLRLAEEQLEVGKRQIETGRARIRRFVTEKPVEAQVNKTARVAEEVLIRREGSDHVETVKDTVRRQQVELERLPRDLRDTKKAA